MRKRSRGNTRNAGMHSYKEMGKKSRMNHELIGRLIFGIPSELPNNTKQTGNGCSERWLVCPCRALSLCGCNWSNSRYGVWLVWRLARTIFSHSCFSGLLSDPWC